MFAFVCNVPNVHVFAFNIRTFTFNVQWGVSCLWLAGILEQSVVFFNGVMECKGG